jgi:hypothetical protein
VAKRRPSALHITQTNAENAAQMQPLISPRPPAYIISVLLNSALAAPLELENELLGDLLNPAVPA